MSSDDLSAPKAGFPLRRNGTCLDSEVSCGPTWGDFYACCPGDSICPGTKNPYYNNVCCPSWANCTIPLMESPHCADTTGTLFDHTGYFCCLPGQTGFWTSSPTDAVGCSNTYPNNENETILVAIETASTSTSLPLSTATSSESSTETAAASASSTATSTNNTADSSGGTNTGAIAGGVVGGVAGLTLILALVWFLIRRQRKQKEIEPPSPVSEPPPVYGGARSKGGLRELQGEQVSELVGNHPVHEMPADNNKV